MLNLNDQQTDGNPQPASPGDVRLYLPYPEGWEARIKQTWEKEYCYAQNPGEDWFHLLVRGEIYVARGNEKYCLNCARRQAIVSTDRLHWQHRPKHPLPVCCHAVGVSAVLSNRDRVSGYGELACDA
jgi:hypothetical protein